ncbi:MAG: hypothetical protein U9Q70_01620 [Chloroflexota bacterium]|nr:hypothetical protein [Chloroflexota bacterium]
MDGWLFPVLIIVILGIVGLTAWLVSVLVKGGDAPREAVTRQPGSAKNSLLSVDRDERGIWQVWVKGKLYHKLAEVPEQATRREVVDAVRILAGFSREYISREHHTAAAAPKKPSLTGGEPPTFLKDTAPKLSQKPPVFMPRIDLAKEIGEIMKELLQQRPSLAHRSIYLQNSLDGSVSFIVDGESYSAVGDILDLEVQALIRAATRKWEERR